ncbi:MAG: multiple sugar transport system permease protein [Thermotogaceae bacterium]|nr:multiple sugar transport system permease protein [Thermotogaceae bacterium]
MKNPIFKIIIYALVLIGVMLMISPFVWMIMTSFKLDGEVESWPPKWISQSFSSHREIKLSLVRSGGVTIDFSALTIEEFFNLNKIIEAQTSTQSPLVYSVNDDSPYRGVMTVDFAPDSETVDFCKEVTPEELDDLNALFESNQPLSENIYETYSNMILIEDPMTMINTLMNFLYYEHDSPLTRMVLVKDIQAVTEKISSFINQNGDKLKNHTSFEISPEDDEQTRSEKASKKAYTQMVVDTIESKLGKFSLYLDEFRKGNPIVSKSELQAFLNRAREQFNEVTLPEGYASWAPLRLLEKNVVTPLFSIFNSVNLGIEVYTFYNEIQDLTSETTKLVFKFSEPETIAQEIRTALEDTGFSNENKQLLNQLISNNLENSVNEIYKRLDQRFEAELSNYDMTKKEKSALNSRVKAYCEQFTGILSGHSTLENTFQQQLLNGEDPTQIINDSSLERGQKDLMLSILTQAEAYLTRTTQDQGESFRLLGKRYESEVFAQYYTSLYSQVFNKMEIIEAPEFVESVIYRNLASVEIQLKDVHPIWFWDENTRMEVDYTFTDVFKNIFQNYVNAWKAGKYFGQYYLNTIFVAVTTTVLDILFACMAAFAFSKMKFFGRDFIFMLFLATMMVPGEVLLVPNYITLSVFGWIDTYYALIVPWTVSVFVIFLIRQHFMSIPDELYDAGKMDGISKWGFLWKIMVPLSKPVIITGSLLKFIGSWNAFLWVLIVTKSPEVRTLPVGLANFSSEVGTLYNQLMAASTFSMLPIVILFLFVQKYFIQGIARTGLK